MDRQSSFKGAPAGKPLEQSFAAVARPWSSRRGGKVLFRRRTGGFGAAGVGDRSSLRKSSGGSRAGRATEAGHHSGFWNWTHPWAAVIGRTGGNHQPARRVITALSRLRLHVLGAV